MTEELKIYVYGSWHFSERLKNDDAVRNGGYGFNKKSVRQNMCP
jgi:hypothetical protein